jgi:hypothetical protein
MELIMKKILFLISFVILTSSMYAQNENDFGVQENDDGTIAISNYSGTAKDIVIPESIKTSEYFIILHIIIKTRLQIVYKNKRHPLAMENRN